MKVLAVDYGEKRVGFAVGSIFLRTATPIEPLQRKNNDQLIRHIRELIDEYDVQTVIVGHPLNMDGTKSDFTLKAEAFANRLKKKVSQDVQLVDERLTSFEAEEALKAHQGNYKKRKKALDSVSAAVLLKRYMDSM